MNPVRYLVAYDIADDDRREGVALYLSGYGPRVQLSVFEVELPDRERATTFRDRLRAMIDHDDDQIRIYPLPADSWKQRLIYGNRTLEERVGYWIVRPEAGTDHQPGPGP
jgi:CRISPR-associated protein Cas2